MSDAQRPALRRLLRCGELQRGEGLPDAALELLQDPLDDVFEGVALEESTWLAGASGEGFVTRADLTGADILGTFGTL